MVLRCLSVCFREVAVVVAVVVEVLLLLLELVRRADMASACSDPPASRPEGAGDVGVGGACVVAACVFFGILGMSMNVKVRRGYRVLLLRARRVEVRE